MMSAARSGPVRAQDLERVVGVAVHADLIADDGEDGEVALEHVGLAAAGDRADTLRTEGSRDRPVAVRDERVVELVLTGEAGLGRGVVAADPDA